MRNKLLATVAVAAVVGFGGFAAAQSQTGGESNKATSGATSGTTQEKSGGSMSGTQSGNKSLNPSSTQSSNPPRNESAQDKSGKDNDRLGQGSKQERNESASGQRHDEQIGAQQDRGLGGTRGIDPDEDDVRAAELLEAERPRRQRALISQLRPGPGASQAMNVTRQAHRRFECERALPGQHVTLCSGHIRVGSS